MVFPSSGRAAAHVTTKGLPLDADAVVEPRWSWLARMAANGLNEGNAFSGRFWRSGGKLDAAAMFLTGAEPAMRRLQGLAMMAAAVGPYGIWPLTK